MQGGVVGGKLPQIRSRLIDATARRMADQSFSKFVAVMCRCEPTPSSNERRRPQAPSFPINDYYRCVRPGRRRSDHMPAKPAASRLIEAGSGTGGAPAPTSGAKSSRLP